MERKADCNLQSLLFILSETVTSDTFQQNVSAKTPRIRNNVFRIVLIAKNTEAYLFPRWELWVRNVLFLVAFKPLVLLHDTIGKRKHCYICFSKLCQLLFSLSVKLRSFIAHACFSFSLLPSQSAGDPIHVNQIFNFNGGIYIRQKDSVIGHNFNISETSYYFIAKQDCQCTQRNYLCELQLNQFWATNVKRKFRGVTIKKISKNISIFWEVWTAMRTYKLN